MQSAKRLILSMLKHYLFWLALFAFARLIFLIWNREELGDVSFGHILFAFVKGLYVDTAMACYLLVIPYLFIAITALTSKQSVMKVNLYVHAVLFFAYFILIFSELPIYDEWHTKLNYKALWFFSNPGEVFSTASGTQTISIMASTLVCTVLATWCYRKLFTEQFDEAKVSRRFAVAVLIVPLVLFIGIRGGFQTIPIQLSDSYYSPNNVLNLASVNSLFNLSSSVIENSKAGEPYEFMSEEDANREFAELFSQKPDSINYVLTTQRPNIVLVVLEGWSADMLESFNGIKGHNIAPNMDSLAMQGIRFTHCYATGSLSDQGMAAVFSAFPAQPLTSIITQPDKYTKLPCISKKLKAEGYYTSFMFGGQLSYGNIRSYMYYNGFDKITEQEHFPDDIPKGKLGAHDEFLFNRQLKELETVRQPFFAAMFTLSTHGPYDFPSDTDLNFGDKEEDYVNSIHYADSCIGDFIEKAKRKPWYKNTLFVFVSDHSHNSPMNYDFNSPEYRRIPFILYGEVIKTDKRRQNHDATMSQVDLAATLLGQLNIDHSEFKYSQNLLGFYPGTCVRKTDFAYYAFEEGFGLKLNHSSMVWSVGGLLSYSYAACEECAPTASADSSYLVRKGQAIMQVISTDYARY
jgi:phosphoglycerol transferase MdoB-like AlkP superfamily enzyme